MIVKNRKTENDSNIFHVKKLFRNNFLFSVYVQWNVNFQLNHWILDALDGIKEKITKTIVWNNGQSDDKVMIGLCWGFFCFLGDFNVGTDGLTIEMRAVNEFFEWKVWLVNRGFNRIWTRVWFSNRFLRSFGLEVSILHLFQDP